MKRVGQYLKVLVYELKMSLAFGVQYRADFALRILRAIVEVVVAVITLEVFFLHTPEIAGWSQAEVVVVFAFYQLISTMVFLWFGNGVDNLREEIMMGNLDQHILMPMDAQFLVGTQVIYITNIFRVLAGILTLGYGLSMLSIPIRLEQIGWALLASVSGAVIYYSLAFMVATTAFWTFSGHFLELLHSITSITRFPVDIFSKGFRIILHVVPLAFIATVPAAALLGKRYWVAAISPLVALVTYGLNRILWQAGLRSYSSVSS